MAQRQVVGECVVSRPKETFRWTTPFFDLHFVEIKSSPKKKRSRRKSSHSRERISPSNSSNEIRIRKMSSNSQNNQPPSSISERRMAKYKEERRRQLASQIANRLSSNHSSSSSDENEDSTSSSLEKYAKYRRHHRSRAQQAQEEVPPVAVRPRRRRKSITKDSVSPGSNPVKSAHVDADGEDNDIDLPREDSPEHIYHQIGTSEVIRVSKNKSPPPPQAASSLSRPEQDNDQIIITKSAASRKPRFPSKEREISHRLSDTGEQPNLRPRLTRTVENPTENVSEADKNITTTKKPLLNTSYSSEEILLQAASSLQGLEDEFRNSSQYALKHRGSLKQQTPMDQTQEKKFAKTLSSPEMIKSVTRTLTPPISPFHKADNLRAERVSPPSSSASTSSNVPISDPFIDANWPGRPKRNSFGEEIAKPSLPKTRQVSTPSPGTASKPPIFPTSPKVIGNDEMPPFMKEFVMRRTTTSQQQSPSETTPTKRKPTPQIRPQSAFIPQSRKSAANSDTRRRSDFVSRYESLLSRAQAATKAVDELDLLRLQRAKDVQAQAADANSDKDEEESVDFNEEEVLQRCQDFQKDYEQRKIQQQIPPVPKPRHFIQGRPLAEEVPRPSLRTRSSSLTLHDKSEEEVPKMTKIQENNPIFPKPILKKSSDDIRETRPILKRKDSESSITLPSQASATSSASTTNSSSSTGILKRKSVTDSEASANNRPEHVRIRSPSPDFDTIRPILVRSRNSSLGEEEFPQSILKKRSGSQEDLIMDGDISASAGTSGATSRSSPEPPVHGILKRKLSLGNASPEQSIAGAISSILKKSGASSSGQGSLEDLTSGSDGIKSILKKRHQAAGSTDDELDQEDNQHHAQPQIKPRSILKSRRSEESLSPLSDDCVAVIAGSAGISNNVDNDILKPILKQRDSSRDEGYHSSKLRDKSRSPSRGAVTSPPENINEVLFSGSSGVSTPLSNSNRRSSLTFSPKRSVTEENNESSSASPVRKASFVSKTTVFLEPGASKPMLDRFDSSSLPTSPTSDEISASIGGILKRKGSTGAVVAPILNSADSCLETENASAVASQQTKRRGVLKKDSSYDDTLKPILKNNGHETISILPQNTKLNDSVSSTSSEDLENLIDNNNRGFVDVVIDPIPQAPNADSSEDEFKLRSSPRKSSLGPRLPVIPPSSVKITSDGNLACKLEALSGQAEAKLKQMEEEQKLHQQKVIPEKSSRKGSQDLPASEYYKIYQRSKKFSNSERPNEEVIISNQDNDIMEKSEVKVQGGGIAERLAALKKNGEENWKKKVPVKKVEISKNLIDNGNNEDTNGNSEVLLRKKSNSERPGGKVGSLQERMSQLQTAQTSWQAKVSEKDANKFTVAGKMQRVSLSEMNEVNEKLHQRIKPKLRRFHGSPPPANDRSYDEVETESNSENIENYAQIEILQPDEDLDKFFTTYDQKPQENIEIDAFDAVQSENNLMLRKNVIKKPTNRTRKSRNPVKALANRTDIKDTYNETSKVQVVLNMDETPKKKDVHSHLAAEAKAALAATEDFSSVQLKKDNKVVPHAEFVPYKQPGETMLLHIKGRRMCQTRLVSPTPSSINSGDAYVAINGTEIIVWQGTYSNVIEKSKSADIGQLIVQRRDLGCKKARRVLLVEEEKITDSNFANKMFWKMLGCDKSGKAAKAGPPEEDENYELEINDKNLVWNVNEESCELIPIEEFWGFPMKHEILTNEYQVLVFDFGNEVYVYNGKNAPFSKRRLGLKLAKDMLKEDKRPDWHLFGRINQNMETCLFKEKFLNWPDKSRLIKTEAKKSKSNNDDMGKLSTDVENNFDAIDMSRWPLQEPNYELEGTFLGRGRSWYDAAERRQYEIDTLSIHFWHVTDKDILELPQSEHGQFYSGATYVVRWKYKVSLTGRDLKGRPSKHVAVGRERWAYFFWHGQDSKAAEQGISALMTVELDEEKGPQIRVEQGHEPVVFLNLWKGQMVIHKGRRNAKLDENRLYFVQGECEEEACAIQVDCQSKSLRSRGAFVLIKKDKKFIWKGQGLPKHKLQVLDNLNWAKNSTLELEGQESEDFKLALQGKQNEFLKGLDEPKASMRLYHMTSVSGEFQVQEVVCPYLNENVNNVLSFNQNHLYKAEQPALFLVESGTEKLWLWQGWWPDVGHEANDTNMTTGSGMIRWHAERREAMRTIKEFQRSKFSKISTPRPPMELVWAGHEPIEFTNLFPSWTHHDEVENLNAKFVKDKSLDRTFALLGRDNYSWEELKQRPLPDGVDPSRLEKYLSDEDFVVHLGLNREDFMACPRWKQLEIRKEKGLF